MVWRGCLHVSQDFITVSNITCVVLLHTLIESYHRYLLVGGNVGYRVVVVECHRVPIIGRRVRVWEGV